MGSANSVIPLQPLREAPRSRPRAATARAQGHANKRFVPPGARHTLAHFIERLVLSEALSLPLDAVTRCIAILARRETRAHAAAVLVEEMVADRLPVVVLDTKGSWAGLRYATDGSQPGLPLQVFGGSQGGIELRPSAGRLVADCATALAQPLVVDLSGMPRESVVFFVNEFVDQLRRLAPRAMHLVLDEAHWMAGENNPDGVAALLELIDSQGPLRVGMTLVTDSPTLVDRRILSRLHALIAGRTAERADQDVVWRWVEARADRRTATRVAESLASLGANQAWVCSPDWLGTCQRLTLRPRATCAALSDRAVAPLRPPQSQAAAVELGRLQGRAGEAQDPVAAPRPMPLPPRQVLPEQAPHVPLRSASRAGADFDARQARVAPRARRVAAAVASDRKPRRGRPVAELVLARGERTALEQYAAQGGARAAVAQRARIILACAEGRLNGEVARELGITIQMVGRWRRRFVEHRLDGLWRMESVAAGGRLRDAQGEAP